MTYSVNTSYLYHDLIILFIITIAVSPTGKTATVIQTYLRPINKANATTIAPTPIFIQKDKSSD